jgi:ABC-type branched-subunit amino acid transport system ATPase component
LPYGGQRCLEIARAVATQPETLLLDEPAAGMNPSETAELMDLILKLRDTGLTIFLVEQNAHMALNISNTGYVMETGRIVLTDRASALLQNEKVKKAYLGE